MLEGRKLLVTGVVNNDSIAFAVAHRAMELGAELVLTSFERDMERTLEAASELGDDLDVLELDVCEEAHYERLEGQLRERWGHLDGALHAVAFAPRDALAGHFLDARRSSTELAFSTSAYSYAALAGLLDHLAPPTGASIVGLDFDGSGAWPGYNWMGVCKAALESTSRYVARDLGSRGIRSNLVAAGPLHTRAAGGIPDFGQILEAWEARSPLRWDAHDPEPVADVVCFLFSDAARAITAEIIHVDGGYHAMAANLR